MIVAEAIVTANWRKNWPEIPGINAAGMNTAESTSAIAISAPPTSSIVRCDASYPRLVFSSASMSLCRSRRSRIAAIFSARFLTREPLDALSIASLLSRR